MHLVLNTFGTGVFVENAMFKVVHKDGNRMIAPSKIKTISIGKGANISSDAALLAIDNEIDVMFIDDLGKPAGRIWSVKYGSISTIRRRQLEFIGTPAAVEWIKEIIVQKIDNQQAMMISLNTDHQNDELLKKALSKLDDYKTKLKSAEGELIADLAPTFRGWEGAASKVYFGVINQFMPEKYRFEGRSQHPATDVFNCLLNYGYGMLYGKVEGALIKAGLDPYTGVLHRDDYNRPVLAYDVIEIYRVWVDYVVVSLCLQEVIDEDCYSIKDGGSYWLENMGKRILIQSINDYLSEVIRMKGNERSRATQIELYAQSLAQRVKGEREKGGKENGEGGNEI